MYLIYLDESGNSGLNLHDSAQPIFVLAALIVPARSWPELDLRLSAAVEQYFPAQRPPKFEIHATDIRNGSGYFRQFPVQLRIDFRDECLRIAQEFGLKLVYRAIEKKQFLRWIQRTFGPGVMINPHIAAFPLVARVVDEYLKSLPDSPYGIFIADENREIIPDIEKAIHLLRGMDGTLRLSQIIEKGFFIDSSKSLALQLCDLCAFHARKKTEYDKGIAVKPMDESGIRLIEPLIHLGNEALGDTIQWIYDQQKKERPGESPGSV